MRSLRNDLADLCAVLYMFLIITCMGALVLATRPAVSVPHWHRNVKIIAVSWLLLAFAALAWYLLNLVRKFLRPSTRQSAAPQVPAAGRIRITLELSAEAFAIVGRLKGELGLEEEADVLRHALKLLDNFTTRKRAGWSFFARRYSQEVPVTTDVH